MTGEVLIAGGGLGAVRSAQALRDRGFEGSITVLSAEDELPYDRPQLSKGFLLGEHEEEELRLVSADELSKHRIHLRLGCRATGLDVERRRVTIGGGEQLGYDDLVIATGAHPIIPAFCERCENVMCLRELGEARALREALRDRPRVGIVGGGFIGLEVAAVASELGCAVDVVEAAAEPLAGVLGNELGGWIRAWHEEQGVAFSCGSMLAGLRGDDRAETLILGDGRAIDVDLVVLGIGVLPTVEWLRDSRLELHRGLVCDPWGRTSDGHVFGVGDATCRHRGDACRPSGHWTATTRDARVIAEILLGGTLGDPPDEDGYFWSDQFDARLQFAGEVTPESELAIVAGSFAAHRFVARCEQAGRATGIFAVDSPRDFIRERLALRRRALYPSS